ncbi:undecaprenyl/decaprenyl-phosphate alpha-N-acetylglucosaminyl 1-phosphate transferase [bacterium]|nr:undecaprenyl/decaprenyl-phosphate alpha-N-acetylglucosaminyl 1-phosphate transferase [bacterium]
MTQLIILILCALVEMILIKVYIQIAYRFKIVDLPGKRKMHTQIKARGAGLTFFPLFIITFLLLSRFAGIPVMNGKMILWFVLGGSVFFMGFLDDLFNLNPYIKLIFQIAVASVFVIFIDKATIFMKMPLLQYGVSIIWIVGIMNSFNLLDNMDGLSSGIALISSLIFAFISYQTGNVPLAYLYLILAFVMLGFLPMNFYPSKVFMGDSGSLFIGYTIATLSIMGGYTEISRLTQLPVIIPVIILSVPIYDSLSVIYIRLKKKQALFVGDQNHFSHRLYRLGLSHKNSVLFIYLVTFSTGVSAFLLLLVNWIGAIILLLQDLILFVMLSILISVKREKKHED